MSGSKASPSRIAAIHLRALPLEAVFSDAPSVAAGEVGDGLGPCAVRDVERGRATLVAVSESALAGGVRPGMTEAEGRATLAELAVHDREPALELTRLQNAAELLFAYGPQVEVCPPATLFVELGRSRRALRRRFGTLGEAEILERLVQDFARIGHVVTAALADDPDTARTLAAHLSAARRRLPSSPPVAKQPAGEASSRSRGKRDAEPAPPSRIESVRVASPGRGRAALSALPLEALAWTVPREDPDRRLEIACHGVCEALRQLGFRRVAELERMSAKEMGARFGEPGRLLHDRAQVARHRPLAPHRPAERLEERFELDAPTEDLEPILFVLRRLLVRLEARLEARQRAAGALTLDFLVEPGLDRKIAIDAPRAASSKRRVDLEVKLARPTRSAVTIFSVAKEAIGGALPGAVLSLRVVAKQPETDRGAQLDLFSRRAQKAEALAELVGRLTAAVGESGVFSPEMVDTHRPEEAWRPRPFSVDAALAPPPAPAARSLSVATPAVVASAGPTHQPLPSVDAALSVTGSSPSAGSGPLSVTGSSPSAGSGPLSVTGSSPSAGSGPLSVTGSSPSAGSGPLSVTGSSPSAGSGPLSVTGSSPSAGSGPPKEDDEAQAPWPKPKIRRPEDEPVPPLPPRPMELLEVPEPARFAPGGDVLAWRGRRTRLAAVGSREHLRTEWWRAPRALERDYYRVETEDGRALWVFVTPDGAAYVHGIFD